MLIFEKPENPEKNCRSKDKNQQQTQPTYDTGFGNQTRDTLVGGERSHHCAIPAPHDFGTLLFFVRFVLVPRYNQASNILDCSQSPIFPGDRRCRSLSSMGHHFGFSIRAKLENALGKLFFLLGTDNVHGQDYSIFLRQKEGIVLIYHDYQLSK